jgi:hypothetical protein
MPRKQNQRRYTHTCTRCGQTWRGYTRKPMKCRFCGSIYWDRPRRGDAVESRRPGDAKQVQQSLAPEGGPEPPVSGAC